MHDYIPFILSEEESHVRSEIAGKKVSVVYDGTRCLSEALAIILRFVSKIEQRLVRVQMLSKSLPGEEIARELISVLSVSFSIGSSDLLASMRDSLASQTHFRKWVWLARLYER